MVDERHALPGRKMASVINGVHFVSGHPIKGNMPNGISRAIFGLGCFWGAEKGFWQIPGVYATAVVYVAGFTENPTYEEVCSGMTGHNEAVLVFYSEENLTYGHLLRVFWEAHDPTQGLRQGNDVGSQYRSGIYTDNSSQFELATLSMDQYQKKLMDQNFGKISTEILSIDQFYYAEEYHQQYLAKNPQGYCGSGGTGVCFGSDCVTERPLA